MHVIVGNKSKRYSLRKDEDQCVLPRKKKAIYKVQ